MPDPVDSGRPLLVAGPGSVGRLPEVLSWWRPQRVLLVGSRRAVTASAALGLLGDAAVTWYDAVRPSTGWVQVADLVRLVEKSRPDVVVGLGGGSVLDAAKLGRVLREPEPRPKPRLRKRPARLVLVPTTAGSGAEMTRFAAFGAGPGRRGVDHPAMLADVAIVDPRLTDSCPPAVTYPAAFDALAHALESFWSARSTPASRALSWQSATELADVLAAPLDAPAPKQRNRLAAAATRAGRAVDSTRTGAVQAYAGWLSAHRQVPHGVACLLTLSWLLPYNCLHLAEGCTDKRGPGFAGERLRTVCGVLAGPGASPEAAAEALGALVRQAGWSDRLGAYGLAAGTLPEYVDAGLAAGNPVALEPHRVAAAIQVQL
ncbi:MAG TPA: iron-containing alcohol dehydrogenase [Mycobacteriales bacterium]|jgi:alcohol dehydrogenase class IV|nr:iron-containing alcohol dehydrogenase [Mycobacteriales bacterium]